MEDQVHVVMLRKKESLVDIFQ